MKYTRNLNIRALLVSRIEVRALDPMVIPEPGVRGDTVGYDRVGSTFPNGELEPQCLNAFFITIFLILVLLIMEMNPSPRLPYLIPCSESI